ncbi:MAG: voltage-gated potassium channel [Methanofollis sp.]|nr:voltage-gated potassium channel [Methanofollis sp.]
MNRPSSLFKRVAGSYRARIVLFLLLLAAYLVVFTAVFHTGYPLWEGEPITWEEAVLFVMETVTTVGYGYLLPFESEYTILLTIVMIVTGVFLIFIFIPLLLAPALSEYLQASPPRRLSSPMKGHTVVIGSGEMTKSLIESLGIADLPIVIVEEDREHAHQLLRRFGDLAWVIWGSYAVASTWRQVFIEDAATVVVCEREGVAASIILGIREMTKAKIVAVVDNPDYDRYLRYAGAEYVLSPKTSAGRTLGRHARAGSQGETIHGSSEEGGALALLRIVSIPVMAGSRLVGKTFAELALPEKYGISVLFFWRKGKFVNFPRGSDRIDASTMLFLLGKGEDVDRAFGEIFRGDREKRDIAVIAGYGDVGRAAYRELTAAGIDCIVVDRKDRGNNVVGEAEDEATLRAAHIEEATTCIVALNNDDVNIFTTLMARNLNPGIRILARANDPSSVDKLYLAGADYVSLLPTIGGQAVAGIVLAGTVRVLLDLPDGSKVVVRRSTRRKGVSVDRIERRCGVRVAGIEGEGRAIVEPDGGETIGQGDAVIAVGHAGPLRKFIRHL